MDKEFQDSVISARRLYHHYQQLNNGRSDPQVRLTALRESGWSGGSKKIGLIEAAERILGIQIQASEFPPMLGDSDPILAMLLRYENKAKIYVSEQENFCRQRFYTAKELCHLIMDDGKDERYIQTSTDILKLLTDLQLDTVLPESRSYPAYNSEYSAFWGACELLLPPEFSDKAEELLNRDVGDSLYQTALHFRVPKVLIEKRFLDADIKSMFEDVYKQHAYKTVNLRPVNLGPNRNNK